MSTQPMPVPDNFQGGTPPPTPPQTQPASVAPVAPSAPGSPSPSAVTQKAQKAVQGVAKAASSLPHMVGAAVQQHDSMVKIRDKQVINMVADAHVTSVQSMQKITETLKPIAEQIQAHMKELEAQPASPQKTMQMSYLAHSLKSVVTALKAESQKIQQAQQTVQALLAEPKNRKLLSRAVGYDEKQANSPERQMLVASLNQKMQAIGQGAAVGAEHPQQQVPVPQTQTQPNAPIPQQQGPQPIPTQDQPVPETGWKHRLKQIATVLGTIAIPEQMQLIPGTPQNKQLLAQKALALREQLIKMQDEQAQIEQRKGMAAKDQAAAAGEVTAEEKKREFDVTHGEKEREFQVREDEVKATREATQAYRDANLQLRKAEFDAKNDPNSLQNKFKLAQLRIEAEKANAAMKTAAQTQAGQGELAQMLVNHQLAPSELPGFGASRATVLGMAMKIDPKYNAAAADRAFTYAKNASTQNTLNYLESLTGPDGKSGNLGNLVTLSNALPRTQFPPINKPELWAKLESGDKKVAGYYTAVRETADQVAKILQGGGTGSATSDAKLKQANDMFDTGFSSDQIQEVATTLGPLLANRKNALIRDNPFLEQQFGAGAQQSGGGGSDADPMGILK